MPVAHGVANQANLDFVLQRMRFLEILQGGRGRFVALRLHVFAFHQQQALHSLHVLREQRGRSFDHRDHLRENAHADEQLEVILADVIDVFVFAGRPAGNDDDCGMDHRVRI